MEDPSTSLGMTRRTRDDKGNSMRIIADLQLHSKFSRAVSKEMTIPNLALWAKKKGIGLIATGDWTHPKWFMEIERDLEEVGNGLLRLKSTASGALSARGDEYSYATALSASGNKNFLDPLLAKGLPSIHEDSAKLGKRSAKILSPSAIRPHVAYTIEFYPEEGKYHYTGHRACNVRLTPEETRRFGKTCSVCGKPLTEGVMQRVETLSSLHADGKPVRTEENIGLYKKPIDGISVLGTYSKAFPKRPPFVMLVPLREIISECIGSPVASPKVSVKYDLLLEVFGTEFAVLLSVLKEEIERIVGPRIAEGIEKVRTGDIVIDPGYDGVFGVVKLWKDDEEKPLIDATKVQLGLLEQK